MKKPRVFVCEGSGCKKHKPALKKLIRSLEPVAEVKAVGCQDICAGPVVGAEVEGQLRWFRELDSPKAREALVLLLTKGELKKRLAKRQVG